MATLAMSHPCRVVGFLNRSMISVAERGDGTERGWDSLPTSPRATI